MEFPADALIRVPLEQVEPGKVFLADRSWFYRLPRNPNDVPEVCRAIHITGRQLGRMITIEGTDRVATLADGWSCAVRVAEAADFKVGEAEPGRIALGPRGPYLIASDFQSNTWAIIWGDISNRWSDVTQGDRIVLAAWKWRAVLVKDGSTEDGPELFTVPSPTVAMA